MGDVIEGELMLPEGAGQGGGRKRHNVFVDEDTVREVIAERVRGDSLRKIAAKWKISPETVRRWCGEDLKRRQATDVSALRAEASQQLTVVRDEAWRLYEAGKLTHSPKTMDAALARVESTTMAKAKLHGAIEPVRVDMQVTAVTQAEQELQEMLNEAATRAAVEEQAVIDAANADPDL